MGFLTYLLMGVIALGLGWAVRLYYLHKHHLKKHDLKKHDLEKMPKFQANQSYFDLTHPKVIRILMGFFVLMLVVSWALGQFVLHHQGIDWAFVIVNSLVATFIFSFGLCPDGLA